MSTRKVDLNKLCDKLHDAQQTGDTDPTAKSKQVFVDRTGGVKFGDEVPSSETRQLSRVQQDVFADRLSDEGRVAETKMPAGTKRMKSRDGTDGWLYGFSCAFGRFYKMFAYWDGSAYQVVVLEPALETKWKSVHSGHLFSNGSICFGSGSGGRPTLESAYAKSVVWANGMSVALKTGNFPFNYNQ